MFFLVGRVLGKRRQGLFGPTPLGPNGAGGEEGLEFGYCFDVHSPHPTHAMLLFSTDQMCDDQVSIRAYLPIWAFLYILQFLLMPLIAQDYWVSNFFGNTMYLMALSYYFIITFLGYNGKAKSLPISENLVALIHFQTALPFLSRTEVLLAPIPVLVIIWFISLFTFDCATNLAPVLWCGVSLRKPV